MPHNIKKKASDAIWRNVAS